jgi:hypothetical protein
MAINQQGPNAADSVQELLQDLKVKAQDAEQDGDHRLFGVLNELIGHTSKVATKVYARQIREERAEHNKAFKALKQKFRESAQNPKLRREDED